jgi:hypothetical protein
MIRAKSTSLAPRGCLVRVTSGTDQYNPRARWFAVGIYFQKMAEAAVCNLPQIESTDVVFALRPLKPAEIETLRLRRGQVMPCSVSDDIKWSLCQIPHGSPLGFQSVE